MNNSITTITDSKIAYLIADYNDISDSDFPLSVEGIDLLTNNYFSLGFTYSRAINEHLTLGVSPHIHFNLIGIKTKNIGYNVILKELEYGEKEYNGTFDGEVLIGLPVELKPDAINGDELDLNDGLLRNNWQEDLTFQDLLRNKSLSFDFGAAYTIKKVTFSASILNIGASRWKTNAYILDGYNETVRVKEADKITTSIPAKIYIGANRQFSSKWNYGFVFNNTFYSSGSNASATLSLNGYVGSMLSTSISYTAGYKFNNVGLGFRLRFFPGTDLYFVTDNFIQLLSYKKAYRMSAAFGINLSFGVKNDSDVTNVSNEELM